MCGIVGFTGKKNATDILMEGLSRLEYRGYDSAGIAVQNEENIIVMKAKGHLEVLYEKLKRDGIPEGNTGIGHTRWATHGEPSEQNAHPHVSSDGKVALVHNGIIENDKTLREMLGAKGYTFSSETDTETAVNLIAHYYSQTSNPHKAIESAMQEIVGSYAFAILFFDIKGALFAARNESPLIIGLNENGHFLASDIPAILSHTHLIYHMENQEFAEIRQESVTFFHKSGQILKKTPHEITWNMEIAEKNGYPHFMLKEIHEQPRAVRDTIHSLIKNRKIDFSSVGLTKDVLAQTENIQIIGCGSAYHVGVAASYAIESLAGISAHAEYASEYRYRPPIPGENTLVIVISQSGETADTLCAMREAKKRGIPTIAIVNVIGSSIAREADHVLYTLAGPEIAVATTKAYSAQLAVCYLFAIALGNAKNTLDDEKYGLFLSEMLNLPKKIEEILIHEKQLQSIAKEICGKEHLFLIGRGEDFATCLEGSLKIKEISYIHAEAYAAGELKHGTISLIEKDTPVIGILTQAKIAAKTLSNMREVKSRGAYTICISSETHTHDIRADRMILIPETLECFAPALSVVPLQLLGYHTSILKGLDVDKPRNLAKSVTVE